MLFRALIGVTLALLAATVQGAPAFTGNSINAQFDGTRLSVNLRDQNVLIGGPSLNVTVGTILINGVPQQQLPGPVVEVIQALQFGVCLTIGDLNFDPQAVTSVAVQLTAGNLRQQTVTAIVPIVLAPGPTIDIADTQQQFRCNDPNSRPIANAGPDRTVAATTVVLDGSGSSDPDPGTVLTYEWFDLDADKSLGAPSTSPLLSANLGVGPHNIQLTVTDDSGDVEIGSAFDDVLITVTAAVPPTANAGTTRTVADSNGQPGESVTLDGSASTDADGTIVTYEWIRFIDADTFQSLGNGATITVTLPDGANDIRLNVTDNDGNRDTDQVVITVAAPIANAAPTANAGADRNIADSDGQPGESVTLDGSASTDTDGTLTSFEWHRVTGSESSETLGTGRTLTVTLPDGTNDIFLIVTDNGGNTAVDGVLITIAAPPPETVLSELPGLTPNQSRMATKLDSMCDSLAALANGESALTADQTDLLNKCNGIRRRTAINGAAQQIEAIEELIPDDFSVARTQTLLFANTQYASIMDRLMALRGGAKGLSLAGLNIIVDGKMVPLAQLEDMAKQMLGGGASSDGSSADEPGGLLSDKWGLWARGNFSFGKKDQSPTSPAFDADQWAFVGGLDYRLSDKAVLGAALSYGSSSVEFKSDDGKLDTDSFSLSLYGSAYAAKNFYFDGIVNFQNSSYDAFRNITYVDGIGLVDVDASGDTDGTTLSGGLSAGYDFLAGGLTISPNVGFFYIDTTIDSFTEKGAAGLNLIYDEQKFKSMTGNAGLRLTYAWNLSWGVLLPHLRVDYVREFEDDVDVFGVRFANDPNATSTAPVLVATDNPDTSYWRLAGGFSAQFKHGISGYIEYQRLESFEFISFQDVSIGLRFQRSF
ncbi:MAG TPA: autotransporter domain-containing protein [Steroidobacteraceae bacterium]|nr:autotransporter domain-containing protein [Steroidobacteraceae bacterium]